jgi:chromosome condensin MukBEF complex kleisin-like MukF subunit
VDRYKQIYDDFVSQQNKNKQTLIDRRQQLDDQVTELEKKSGGLFSNAKKKLEQMKDDQAAERGDIQSKLTAINKAIDDEYQSFLAKVDQANTTETDVFDVSELLLQIEMNNDQILELQNQVSETDIGSFRFIAQAFDIDVDTAVKWFIIMIVVVFDPLAMCLIIGYNVYVHGQASFQQKGVIPTTFSNTSGVKITAVKK